MTSGEISQQIHEFSEMMYCEGFNDGATAGGYKDGMNDTWECMKSILDLWFNKMHCDPGRFSQYFNLNAKLDDDVLDLFFEQYSPSRAIKTMKEYKKEKYQDVKRCCSCNHCEMCKWIEKVNKDGCEFYSGE